MMKSAIWVLLALTLGAGCAAKRAYNRGVKLAADAQYGKATLCFRKAAEKKPDFAYAHYNRAKCYEKLGAKDIDGLAAKGYRVFDDDVIITIWIEAATGELVLVEQEYPSSPGMDFVMRDIQLDVALDDSLFSLTPPDGYKPGPKLSADVAQLTEADFIRFFETWIDLATDKTFPPTFWGPEFAKVVMDMATQGKFARPWTEADAQVVYQGGMFLAQIPQDDWRYMGANVPFGDADTPVFWYRPVGGQMYRVIYADLSARDVAPGDLPQ